MKPAVQSALRMAAAVAAALLVLWMLSRLEFREALGIARTADPRLLLAAVALMVVSLGLRVVRSLYIFRAAGWQRVPARTVALVTLAGFSLSKVTPGGSGDLLRATAFRDHDLRSLDVAAVVIYERVLDLLAMIGLLALGIFALTLGWTFAVVMIIAAALIGLGLLRQVLRMLAAAPLSMPTGLVRLQLSLDTPALRPLLQTRVGSVAATLTLANFASESLRALLVYRALGIETGIAGVLVLLLLPYTVALLSLIPLGVGSWDATVALTFERFGFPLEAGAAAAVLLRVVLTVPTLCTGLAAWLILRSNRTPAEVVAASVPPPESTGVRPPA